MKSAHKIYTPRAPIKHSNYSKIVLAARRRFYENSNLEPDKSLYPLHDAVEKGDIYDIELNKINKQR